MVNSSGIITTIAGSGQNGPSGGGFGGDSGPANQALFGYPNGLALDKSGSLFITDYENQRIRVINKTPPVILSVAYEPALLWPPDHRMVDKKISVVTKNYHKYL